MGNLSNKVVGSLLRVREVDIATQEGDRLCTSRIMDIRNGKGNQGYRRLSSGPAIQRTRVLPTAVAPSDAPSHVRSAANSARSR